MKLYAVLIRKRTRALIIKARIALHTVGDLHNSESRRAIGSHIFFRDISARGRKSDFIHKHLSTDINDLDFIISYPPRNVNKRRTGSPIPINALGNPQKKNLIRRKQKDNPDRLNKYNGQNDRRTKAYGNGAYIENVYDVLDRIVQIKYNGSIKYKYAYNGNGDLCEIEDVANSIKYRYEYDSLGNITAINRNGYAPISYTYDVQNQLTKVVEGDVRYEYAYDAWGKFTNSSSLAQINPIRYRGYYYDTDTGFYYLQSRYVEKYKEILGENFIIVIDMYK